MKKLLATAAILIACSSVAHANSVAVFREGIAGSEHQKNSLTIYVSGLGTAFLAANVVISGNGGKPLFCQPGKLALNIDNYMTILGEEIRLSPELGGDFPMSLALLKGLQRTFPCK